MKKAVQYIIYLGFSVAFTQHTNTQTYTQTHTDTHAPKHLRIVHCTHRDRSPTTTSRFLQILSQLFFVLYIKVSLYIRVYKDMRPDGVEGPPTGHTHKHIHTQTHTDTGAHRTREHTQHAHTTIYKYTRPEMKNNKTVVQSFQYQRIAEHTLNPRFTIGLSL